MPKMLATDLLPPHQLLHHHPPAPRIAQTPSHPYLPCLHCHHQFSAYHQLVNFPSDSQAFAERVDRANRRYGSSEQKTPRLIFVWSTKGTRMPTWMTPFLRTLPRRLYLLYQNDETYHVTTCGSRSSRNRFDDQILRNRVFGNNFSSNTTVFQRTTLKIMYPTNPARECFNV